MYLAKFKYITFFYRNICICQKKVVPLHQKLKNINNQLKNSHYENKCNTKSNVLQLSYFRLFLS